MYFLYFDIWGLADSAETAPQPIPRGRKGLAYKYAFRMQTKQSRAHLAHHLLSPAFMLWATIPLS